MIVKDRSSWVAFSMAFWFPTLMFFFFLFEIFAAVETTTVQGKVILPSGVVASGGKLTLTLSQIGSTPDTSTAEEEVVLGWFTTSISSSGVVDFALVPNDAVSPAGTYYAVSYNVTSPIRASWSEKWSVTTSPDPVDIGDITRVDPPAGITVGVYLTRAAAAPSGVCTANDVPTLALDTWGIYECVSSTWARTAGVLEDDSLLLDNSFPSVPTTCTGSRVIVVDEGAPFSPKICICDPDGDGDGRYELADGSGTAC